MPAFERVVAGTNVTVTRLDDYQRRRDFAATPEPSGARASGADAGRQFVVQEHHARTLHWDLRLEHDGVLASWAVPKGIPAAPGIRRLAKRTEDHPEEYLRFEGTIPEGEYGAGQMSIWDRGTYGCEKWEDDEVLFTFHGERVQGRYVLIRTRNRDWMLQRLDPAAEWAAPPTGGPMLATVGPELPVGADWWYELKWDGIRCLARIEGGRPHLESRRGNDITAQYPELRALGEVLGSTAVLLDGEIIAFDANGRPDFHRLQRRMHATGEYHIRRLTSEVPVSYAIFDLLWVDGHDLTALPLRERRRRLETLGLDQGERAGVNWTLSPVRDDPALLMEVAEALDLEGLMAKRVDSPYLLGRRSTGWRKYRRSKRQELVVGGWVAGSGARSSTIGGLLVGYYDDDGALHYAGRVGSGLSDLDLTWLRDALHDIEWETSPFSERGLPKGAHWVEPRLVVEVRFTEWTPTGRLRHPTYLGLRDDKDPATVRRE